MKLPFFIVAVLLIASGISLAAGYGETGKAGGYSIRVTFDKSRPALGPNRVEVTIMDAASQPVAGAQVKIEYFMPSLPGRPSMMEYSIPAESVDGRYGATIDLSMKGIWKMVVSITAAQQTEKMAFTFEVR